MTSITLPSAPSLQKRRPALAPALLSLLLIGAALAAFCNSFHGPLLLDDRSTIQDNATIRRLGALGSVLRPPGDGSTVQGRPVLNLTFALNYAAGGLNVRGYHATNLAIHILAGLALFGLVRRTLRLPSIRPGATGRTPLWAADQCPESTDCGSTGQPKAAGQWHPGFGSPGTADLLAFGVALIWLLHPLQTSAVTYLSQRAESLVGLWYLLTLYCALRGMTVGGPSRWRAWLWYFLAILTCALGMGSKEVMVSAPLIVLLLDRVLVSGSWRELWQRRWGLYVGLAATWILLVVLVWTAQSRGGTAGAHTGISHWHYLLTQAWAIPHYLRLAFWPQPLVFDYGTSVITSLATVWPQMLLMALLLVLTIACWFRFRAVALLLTAFFAILAPSSSFVPVATQTVAEHRMYLPLAVVVILVVIGIYTMAREVRRLLFPRVNPTALGVFASAAALTVLASVAAALGFTTYARNSDYRSTEAIWRDTVRKRPDNWRAQNSLGLCRLDSADPGALMEALDCFQIAITENPGSADAQCNRGLVYVRLGIPAQALLCFDAAIHLNPQSALYHLDRGNIYRTLNQYPQSLADYDQAIALDDHLAHAYYTRSSLLRLMGHPVEAIADANRAIALDATVLEFFIGRGRAYEAAGQYARAIADYDHIVAVDPKLPQAYFQRAVCRYHLGQFKEAAADVARCRQRGGEIDPAFVAALHAATQPTP